MANLITSSLWALSDLERSKSKLLRFQSLISRKEAELGHKLLLPINRKPYMASLMTPSRLTLNYLKGHRNININRKPYMTSPMALSNLTLTDLERSKSLRFSAVGYLYRTHIFSSSNIPTIWVSQKGEGVCWRARFSAIPAVFLVCITLHFTTSIPSTTKTRQNNTMTKRYGETAI